MSTKEIIIFIAIILIAISNLFFVLIIIAGIFEIKKFQKKIRLVKVILQESFFKLISKFFN